MNTILDRLYSFLRSLKLAAVLLVILALLAVAGGIIPQGKPADFYFSRMPSVARLVLWIGFDRLFTSRVFLLVVALFTTNLTVCTVHRLGGELSKPRKARRHGPDLLHLGLIIIIFGSLLTARTRTEKIYHAGLGQHIHLPDGQVLYLTNLRQETYESGRVRAWITEGVLGPAPVEDPHGDSVAGDTLGEEGYALSADMLGIKVLELASIPAAGETPAAPAQAPVSDKPEIPQGKPLTIKVNAPFKGKGYTIYQYDWKTIIHPVLTDSEGKRIVLHGGSRITIPQGSMLFMATEEPPAPQGAPVAPTAVFLVEQQGTRTMVRARPGDTVSSFTLAEYQTQYLSGLKVKTDPWFPLVLAGILLAMAGTVLTYVRKLKGLSA